MPVGEPTIQQGSTGASVTRLQQALQRAGFDPGAVDGNFGPATDAAVRSFQSAKGLTVDGIVGPATWSALCVPAYQPAAWNDGGTVQHNNNCYNYACDLPTNTFAQPGRAAGTSITMDCPSVTAGATADGLAAADCDSDCVQCCHQVALVIWPGQDFHWYRKHDDGTWSHKPGKTAARNYDNSHATITDPRTADRGPYTQFCICCCVCKPNVAIG
jgi:Putative peptidoglycan binding domain